MNALLSGALEPTPPPLQPLVQPEFWPELPAEAASLPVLLPAADLHLQEEVQFDPHPTLTRLWCRRGVSSNTLQVQAGANDDINLQVCTRTTPSICGESITPNDNGVEPAT